MTPFPLQGNLRKLKPSIGKASSGLAVILFFLIDRLRDNLDRIAHIPGIWIAVGFGIAILLISLASMFLRQVYYNENGVGIAMRFGGSETWYSFLELREVKRSSRGPRNKPSIGSKLTLHFHTGSVKINTGLYEKKGIEELVGIITNLEEKLRRVPGVMPEQYKPAASMTAQPKNMDSKPPSFPSGPPKQPKDPGYRNLSKSDPRSLKNQLEEWNRKQMMKSSKK